MKLLFRDKEIKLYDHPGMKREIYCPICKSLLWYLQYKKTKFFVSFSVLEHPLYCEKCKKFYFWRSYPFQLREIHKDWGFRIEK